MTTPPFRDDAYLRSATALVTGHTDQGGVICDASVFYATSGGQPGDSGRLEWDGGALDVAVAVKGEGGAIVLVPAEGATLPPIGAEVTQTLDWDRRHRLMRMHTGLHLLSIVIPLPVTGGSGSEPRGRLDFNMPDAPQDKPALEAALNDLVARDLEVTESWITDAELDANPGLVKSMNVSPPRGTGRVRLVRIGTPDDQVDLQPCGGTHVRRTGEVGPLRLGKIEKKGAQNRRVYIHLEE
ncbi:MAG: alanyl-tRNA editing protein [Rhodobacteraceae bacterium]|nr:alanyl-tRNA editing protein [Paracoccaceae bacterium]